MLGDDDCFINVMASLAGARESGIASSAFGKSDSHK
jgi:hypothetical protein